MSKRAADRTDYAVNWNKRLFTISNNAGAFSSVPEEILEPACIQRRVDRGALDRPMAKEWHCPGFAEPNRAAFESPPGSLAGRAQRQIRDGYGDDRVEAGEGL
jgi:hypothetical protein